jgi:hypothetical protein
MGSGFSRSQIEDTFSTLVLHGKPVPKSFPQDALFNLERALQTAADAGSGSGLRELEALLGSNTSSYAVIAGWNDTHCPQPLRGE